ncbi:sterol carrier protein [bacterium]|nr:MAG: sterol carrier protein [bacterium]
MDCRTLFTEMATRFDGTAAGDWQAVFLFLIDGSNGGEFVLRIGGGVCEVTEGRTDDATTTITTSDETWLGIVDGSVNPMTAFMTGKVKVAGNMGDVMKLQDPSLFRRD